MRILFFYLYGGGGAAQNMAVLYRSLADRDSIKEIMIVCSSSSPLCGLESHPKISVTRVDFSPIKELNRLVVGLWMLKKIVKNYKPDVVLSMNLSSYVKLNAPSLLCINNPYQVYPRDIDKYHPKGRIGALFIRLLFKASLAHADGVVLQTSLMRNYTLRLARRAIPAWTIGKAVEADGDVEFESLPPEACRALASGSRKSFAFMYAATPVPHKNHSVLYRAMDLIRKEGHLIVLLLTLSEADIEATGGELGKSLVRSGHIIPLGFLKKPQLRAAYDEASACVMPSVLESLSSAHLEAMAWKKPQVVVDLPYARDLCGGAAVYCSANDPKSWADAMLIVSQDATLQKRLVAEGEDVIMGMPRSVAEAADHLEAALREVVQASGY